MLAVVSCHVSANPAEVASRTSHLRPSGSSLQLGKPQGLSCHHGASPGGAPLPPPPWHHPPLLPPLPLPRPPLPSPTPPTPPDPCTHLQASLCGYTRDGTEHQPAQVRNSLNFLIKNPIAIPNPRPGTPSCAGTTSGCRRVARGGRRRWWTTRRGSSGARRPASGVAHILHQEIKRNNSIFR